MLEHHIKIYCHNVYGLTARKLHTLLHLLESETYQLICLTESWWLNEPLWATHPLTVHSSMKPATPRTTGHENGGILIMASPSLRPWCRPIHATQYTVSISFGTVLATLCYFPPSLPTTNIIDLLTTTPTSSIYLGDFNARFGDLNQDTERSPALRAQAYLDWFHTRDIPYCPRDFLASSSPCRLDHIFSSTPLHWSSHPSSIHDIQSDHPFMSIHLQARLQPLPAEKPIKDTERLPIQLLRCKAIQKTVCETYNANCSLNDVDIVGSLLLNLHQTDQRFNSSEWLEMLDKVDTLIRFAIFNSTKDVIGSYQVNKEKTRIENPLKKMDDCTDHPSAIRLFKRACRAEVVRILSSNPEITAMEEAVDFYGSLWNPNPDRPPLAAPLQDIATNDFFFSCKQLKQVVKRYPNQKSGGNDGLHIRIYKSLLNSKMSIHLCSLFSLIYKTGITPSAWNEGLTHLIPKKKEEPTAATTRPICLTLMNRRLFEMLCFNMWVSEPWFQPHYTQSGSRRGYSALTQAMASDDISKRGFPLTVLLDIKKAFDSVRHNDILAALQEKGVPERPLALLSSLFFTSNTTRLVVNGEVSDPIPFTRGIFQGSVMSPILFELWIDSLAYELDATRPENDPIPRALFYVDDIALKAKTQEEMQRLLKICEDWSRAHGIEFNVNKSYFLGSGRRFLLYDRELPSSDEQLYLGFPHTSKGIRWDTLVNELVNKAAKTLAFLRKVGPHWPEWVKSILFKVFVRSRMEYGAPVILEWSRRSGATERHTREILKPLDDLLDDSTRWIFNTATKKNLVVLRAMLFVPDCYERFTWLRASFDQHVLKLTPDSPFMVLRNLHGPGPWSTSFLIPRMCLQTVAYKKWRAANDELEFDKRLTLKTHLKNTFLEHLARAPQSLIRCILPSGRHHLSRQDNAIYIQNHESRSAAIRWRRNVALVRSKCPVDDSHNFNRGCLERCGLTLQVLGHARIPRLFLERWVLERQRLLLNGFTGHYTLLDSLLNHRNSLDHFNRAFTVLENWVQPGAPNVNEVLLTALGSQPAD